MTGESRPPRRFGFRTLQPADLPLVSRWRSSEHVARWWGEPGDLEAFLAQVVMPNSAVHGVRIDVAEANRRSWRCLEKLGFRRMREGISVAGEPGPHFVYPLRLGGDPLGSA